MDRLASRVAEGGTITIEEAYRQIAHNLHLLVHLTLVDDTWRGGRRTRFISEIRAITGGIENGRPITHLVYRAHPGGQDHFAPESTMLDELAPYARGAS